jgi:16S rRNA (adenine1518-N6/adenine1519-N6)-dimethyltransferase
MTDLSNLDQTGRHYMIDKTVIDYIVKISELKETDVVLEIGCGKGALTKELISFSLVVAVDIDNDVPFFASDRLLVVHGNILEIISHLKERFDFNKIISNIPYGISEPLFKRLFRTEFDMCILTIGRNFAELLKKKDNRISIIANNLFSIRQMMSVPRKAFNPVPRVDSVILKISRTQPKQLNPVAKIYRDLVFLDNKKIKNAIEKIIENESSFKKMTKKALAQLIEDHKMVEICDKKIYELSNEEFLKFNKFLIKVHK